MATIASNITLNDKWWDILKECIVKKTKEKANKYKANIDVGVGFLIAGLWIFK